MRWLGAKNTHIYTYIHIHIYTHIYTYIHINTHKYIYIYKARATHAGTAAAVPDFRVKCIFIFIHFCLNIYYQLLFHRTS
jgi:hypothetical protein